MKPSIGRIVHFVDDDSNHHAAIVTHVHDNDLINAHVFYDAWGTNSDERRLTSIEHDEGSKKACTWHWPERVE